MITLQIPNEKNIILKSRYNGPEAISSSNSFADIFPLSMLLLSTAQNITRTPSQFTIKATKNDLIIKEIQ